ncbi:hypothetical protein B9Z19DRAFT_1129187 [Tuber borchii]|uniref:Uncharacterized protein n=1 Tax=Tuber borchii TaxID=42251 RepID=A0A2T6ZMU8_TUBBO|nr:hypothetical protein B9Z19DRAFT_1129187 [Tuber borchii]
MVITANFLAVAFRGIFDQSSQPLTSNIMVTYPFTTSIDTEIQRAILVKENLVKTFAKNVQDHWLVINTDVIGGTDLLPWVTDELYFLPFEWKSGNKTGLRTSMTQGYGRNLTCQLLAGNTFQQSSQMNTLQQSSQTNTPLLGINEPTLRSGVGLGPQSLQCKRPKWHASLREPNPRWLGPWRGESKKYSGSSGRNCHQQKDNFRKYAVYTTIICSQQISTGEFRVTVDGEGRVKRFKLIGELKYDDPRLFNRCTSVGDFTAQLAMLFRAPPSHRIDYGIMHNDNSSHSFSQFIGEYLINKTLSDPSTPSRSFEDA